MYLVEAKADLAERAEERLSLTPSPSARWEDFPYSHLSHHGEACCDIAREWVVDMDFAQLNGADLTSGPRWLRAKYKWGPSPWPMHWCDVVCRDTIDCGAHAALSREVFQARGLTAFPAQLVQRYSEEATEQWRGKWSQEDVSCHWVDQNHIYHEATALMMADGTVKIWDASAACWMSPRQPGDGYGSLVAVRIFGDTQRTLKWGNRDLRLNAWNELVS